MAISREEIDKIYAQYGYIRGNPDKSQLTMEEIIAELKKLKDVKNHFGFLYFCLEYVNVSHPAHGSVPFATEMYEWQINAAQDFLKHTQIVSKKVRQVGFSTIVGAYALWRALFFESQNIGIVSLTQRDSVIFLERVKFVYDKLPIWLRQDVSEFAKTTVTFKHNHSKIVSLPNTKDPARGSSLSLLIVDEFADFDSQKDFLSAAVPALSAGLLIPFSDDKLPSQFFIISTLPKSPMTKEGENQYLRILHKAQESADEFKLIEVTVRDIPHYQSEEWHKQMKATLTDRIYSIQVLGQEVYETENLVIPNYVLEKLKEVKPLRVDFLQPDSVDEEGYFKNMAMMPFLKDGVDIEYGYIQGLWVWADPNPEYSYCAVCLPAGEKVLTVEGLKNIEDVTDDDILYSKDGEEIKIINRQINYVKNKSLYTLRVKNIYHKTTFTDEHPIYASKSKITRQWKNGKNEARKWEHDFKFYNVSELQKGDWLQYPNVYALKETSEQEMIKQFNKYKTSRYDFDLPENFIIDEKIWWYIGVWLAEGWVSTSKIHRTNKIQTTHNLKTEYHLIREIQDIFSNYNRSVSFTEKPDTNSLTINVYGKQFGDFLKSTFGHGAKNKHLPEWVKFLPAKYKHQLIKGYLLGDGSIINRHRIVMKKGKKHQREDYDISFVSISLELLEGVQDILFSIGVVSSLSLLRPEGVHIIQGRSCKTQETYQLRTSKNDTLLLLKKLDIETNIVAKQRKSISNCYISNDNKYIYMRISENIATANFTGTVYNFETQTHTFLCNYIATHNCDPATGRANDSSAIQVFCLETNEQVAEYKGKVDTERFKVIIEMITMYYNKAKLVIESTGLGAPICDYFAETLIYENFYWHQHSKNKFTSGFPMSTKNRAQAIAILQSVLVRDIPDDAIKINSVRLMNELRIFGYTKTGRIEAIAGHDDLVMALAMYLWTQAQGFATSDKIFVDEGKEEAKTPAQIHQEEQMHYADIATEGADKYKKQIKKYFHDDFDIETSPQMEEMLRMMAIEGAGIPIQLLRND